MNLAPAEPKRPSPTLRLSTPAAPRKEAPVAPRETPEVSRPSVPWIQRVTRPVPMAVLALLTLALFGWSLQTRSHWNHPLFTSGPTAPPPSASGEEPLDVEQLDRIQKQAVTARARLLQGRDEFHRVLNALEESTRQRGWRTRLSMLPASPAPLGLSELVAYPVSAQVELGDSQRTNGYSSVVDWIAGISRLPNSAEVVGLSLRGDRTGLSSARVEIQFLGKHQGEETAAH